MFHKDGTKGLSERGKRIALKRARLIAGGRQKYWHWKSYTALYSR